MDVPRHGSGAGDAHLVVAELWAAERRKLERYLRRSLARPDAEDVVSAAFAKLATRSQPTVELLWKIAFDEAINLAREELRQDFLEEQAGILGGTAIPSIETAIIRADFDRAFRQLPRAQAEAFALTELRGLTERETADVLGVAQKTINRRCEAARTYLRGELA